VVVIDLWPSQRDTSEIGTPSARAVLAKVPEIVEGRIGGQFGSGKCGLPDLTVVVVAAQQGLPGSPAQDVIAGEVQITHMASNGLLQEPGDRHVPHRRGSLGRGKHRMPVDDHNLLANGEHPSNIVDLTGGQAEGLALPESRACAEEN
jgi:hypothetical protein